ncbi:MAG TPA: PAS domain-containing protein [Parvibaculum sp.]|jgi:hypothetical protein
MLDAISDFLPIEDFSRLTPRLEQLLVYWRAKRTGSLLPSRKDIDPIDIPRLMSDVAFLDIMRDPLDYRYRLVGTHIVEMVGHDRTGLRMREFLTPPAIEASAKSIERLIASREAIAFEGRLYWLQKDYRHFQALVLPLAADGREVDMAIMGLNFSPERRTG